jgi:alkylation response protein AidB-like acyl-CoA dehydrogenase
MHSLISEDQAALEDFCKKLLEKAWPLEKAMKTLGPGGAGHSAELWQVLVEAGWTGLPFDPELGGGGGDLIDLGLVYRAAGERLVPGSFYASMFAALLVARLGTADQKSTLLKRIIAGECLATVASGEPQATENAKFFTTTAAQTGEGWVLNGVKAFVPNLDVADTVLVLAKTRANGERGGWGLFAVETAWLKGAFHRYTTFGGEAWFELKLDNLRVAPAALLGGAPTATLDAFNDVLETATALQCMEMAGGTAEVLRRTVEYVSERKQHGRQIGSFQAVQHLMANASMALQGARVAALQAVFLKSKGRPAAREVSIAKIAVADAYTQATITAQQLWGAMGYARPTGLYLWSERAKVADAWLGGSAGHLRKLADGMGL